MKIRFFEILFIQIFLSACATHPIVNDQAPETPPAVSTPTPEKADDRPTTHLPTHRRPPIPRKQQPPTSTPDQQETRETPAHPTDTTTVIPGAVLLNETFFTVQYDTKLMLPRIVSYFLSAENLKHNFVKRKNHFHADLILPTLGLQSEGPGSFDKGYDRGHKAPSADFAWSEEANEATFTMANMTPQESRLNQQAWQALENAVREFACAEGMIEVASGPVIIDGEELLRLQKNGVAIPKRFYKVVLDQTPPRKAIGFIMNQDDVDRHEFEREVFPLAEVEKITKIRFFDDLKDGSERVAIESKADLTEWRREKCVGILRGESAGSNTDQDDGWEKNKVLIPRSGQAAGSTNQDEGLPEFKAQNSYKPRKSRLRQMKREAGDLRSAQISGCCRGHGGVMGPKRGQACSDWAAKVLCNDGEADVRCSCH